MTTVSIDLFSKGYILEIMLEINIMREQILPQSQMNPLLRRHQPFKRVIAPPDINGMAVILFISCHLCPPQFGYSPTFKPYAFANQAYRRVAYPLTADKADEDFATKGDNTNIYSGSNLNVEPYKIFDAHGGIYIDYWGYEKSENTDNWTNNLWDILGL